MIVDWTYKLPEANYYKEKTVKERIVIGNSFLVNMAHVTGWKTRYNGKYKKTAMFTVAMDGIVYQHFDADYWSDFMQDADVDRGSITILLENEGWLELSSSEKNVYISNTGHIYNRDSRAINIKWRGFKYWAPYNEKQEDALVDLIKYLSFDYKIPAIVAKDNVKMLGASLFHGIMYKSNFGSYFTDVSPAWPFSRFKNKIESDE